MIHIYFCQFLRHFIVHSFILCCQSLITEQFSMHNSIVIISRVFSSNCGHPTQEVNLRAISRAKIFPSNHNNFYEVNKRKLDFDLYFLFIRHFIVHSFILGCQSLITEQFSLHKPRKRWFGSNGDKYCNKACQKSIQSKTQSSS